MPIWMCPNVERILDRPPVTEEEPGWWLDAVIRGNVDLLQPDLDEDPEKGDNVTAIQ